jgi:murein DD-endopeptidase MepM/ murein hydrolase activator NlpD
MRSGWLFIISVILLNGCTRPDYGASPFSDLNDGNATMNANRSEIETEIQQDLVGPEFHIIPDSELVNGPSSINFNLFQFIHDKGGYLDEYQEEIGNRLLRGADILYEISRDYSIHPRVLLALLEHQSRWVTSKEGNSQMTYPLGLHASSHQGLYRQLSWAANKLNQGFYLHRVGGLASIIMLDGQQVNLSEVINSATAAIQYLFSQLYKYQDWQVAVSSLGFYLTYQSLFGELIVGFNPLITEGLVQPVLQLPFAEKEVWNFTAGPHSAWGDGAAWAALDFAPPGAQYGCYESRDWVRAVADGLVVRSENGVVVLDLNKDGYEQTGWTVLYLHIASQDRATFGAQLRAGDRIGHPSCEGGPSSGTHVHIARRYNGEWIPADQDLPFNLDGWISHGTGSEYEGQLIRDGKVVEAYAWFTPENQIQR